MELLDQVVSNSLWPHGLQHARLPCPSLSPRVCLHSCPLSWWCHPFNSSSVVPFSCPQSFLELGSSPMSRLFVSGGQSIRASAQVLPMSIPGWFPLGLTGLISLLSKGLSRVFCSTTVWKHQFLCALHSLWSSSHIHSDGDTNLTKVKKEILAHVNETVCMDDSKKLPRLYCSFSFLTWLSSAQISPQVGSVLKQPQADPGRECFFFPVSRPHGRPLISLTAVTCPPSGPVIVVKGLRYQVWVIRLPWASWKQGGLDLHTKSPKGCWLEKLTNSF